jgi:adenylylsulfate kinase-like enzyme
MVQSPIDSPEAMPDAWDRSVDLLRLATAGSVDDGKSTLIGIDDAYERPQNADVVIRTADEEPHAAVARVLAAIDDASSGADLRR